MKSKEKDRERDRDRDIDSDKNSEDMNKENESDQEEPQKKTEDDAKEAAKTRKPKSFTLIKTGLLLSFIGALSWSIYYLYPLINENLRIGSRIKETTSKIDRIQTEQIQIKEALNSFQNEIDQKLKLQTNNESSQNFLKTVNKLSKEITVLQNEIKTLQDQVKNNSTLLASRQNQIIDLPPQKKPTPEPEPIEKAVDKEGNVDNKVVILIEDSVQLIIKTIGNAFTWWKNSLKKLF